MYKIGDEESKVWFYRSCKVLSGSVSSVFVSSALGLLRDIRFDVSDVEGVIRAILDVKEGGCGQGSNVFREWGKYEDLGTVFDGDKVTVIRGGRSGSTTDDISPSSKSKPEKSISQLNIHKQTNLREAIIMYWYSIIIIEKTYRTYRSQVPSAQNVHAFSTANNISESSDSFNTASEEEDFVKKIVSFGSDYSHDILKEELTAGGVKCYSLLLGAKGAVEKFMEENYENFREEGGGERRREAEELRGKIEEDLERVRRIIPQV
ncbi:hypothetical protein TrST_g12204 [Triparma strigata]|uniref:Uncharacterized protein n=1 Tax=Triparma strigata TaxID=1606541 RepID=A0A9W6ZRH5_9STRA|nr:hypothetical protein TrST_g12204 [Triparma strigata]